MTTKQLIFGLLIAIPLMAYMDYQKCGNWQGCVKEKTEASIKG